MGEPENEKQAKRWHHQQMRFARSRPHIIIFTIALVSRYYTILVCLCERLIIHFFKKKKEGNATRIRYSISYVAPRYHRSPFLAWVTIESDLFHTLLVLYNSHILSMFLTRLSSSCC